ncbi:MAG TPA: ATP-binding cassette domain-containing protein [Abditibacteriaceae bacterium]
MPLLELREVAVGAGGKILLRGVNLRLERGEIVGICGASGCGKTSLLRIMAGLDDALSGTVFLEKLTPDNWTYPLFRRRVIYIEQRPILFDGTIEENLRRPFCYRSTTHAFASERAAQLLKQLQLPHDQSQNARTLSQGQQQRLAIIRALLLQPTVLLLDEPTSALDSEAAHNVETLLQAEVQNGLAILMVTHDRAQAARLCHRICETGDWL